MADRAARDAEARVRVHRRRRSCSSTRTSVEAEERIPGVSVPIRAELRAGDERIGLLLASLPATRTWERADQTLLDLYASEIGVAIRNAELFDQVQDQNRQLRRLGEVKDDFLRGVSHNLQTPLTWIRSNAEALAVTDPDPRLDDHLRTGRPAVADGPAAAPREPARVAAASGRTPTSWPSRRASSEPGTPSPSRIGQLELHDGAPDWLAVADGDQLDQVLWALLDNAVKYGEGTVDGRDRRRRGDAGPSWTTIVRRRVAVSTRPTGRGCSVGSSAARRVGPAATAAASACTSRGR